MKNVKAIAVSASRRFGRGLAATPISPVQGGAGGHPANTWPLSLAVGVTNSDA